MAFSTSSTIKYRHTLIHTWRVWCKSFWLRCARNGICVFLQVRLVTKTRLPHQGLIYFLITWPQLLIGWDNSLHFSSQSKAKTNYNCSHVFSHSCSLAGIGTTLIGQSDYFDYRNCSQLNWTVMLCCFLLSFVTGLRGSPFQSPPRKPKRTRQLHATVPGKIREQQHGWQCDFLRLPSVYCHHYCVFVFSERWS